MKISLFRVNHPGCTASRNCLIRFREIYGKDYEYIYKFIFLFFQKYFKYIK